MGRLATKNLVKSFRKRAVVNKVSIEVNNGEIVEKGRHSELLSAKGFYHSLYMSQFAQPILNKR